MTHFKRILAGLWVTGCMCGGIYGLLWLFKTVPVPSLDAGLGTMAIIFLTAFIGAVGIVAILRIE